MFLKKNSFYLFVFIIIFTHKPVFSKEELSQKIINYLNNLENFSVSFVQLENQDIKEGVISIGENRLRADYLSPSKLIIILSNDKAMYYNVSLEESEFFDPKDTFAWFFFEIFKNPRFLLKDTKINNVDKNIIIEKKGVNFETLYELKVFFENSPLVIRKIELLADNIFLKLSFYNHRYNEEFDRSFFKLIDPSFYK